MPNAEQLLYQTEKEQPLEVFYKKIFLKILQYSWEKICVRQLLKWLYEVIVWNFVSGSHLKPSWLSNITKIPVTFKP